MSDESTHSAVPSELDDAPPTTKLVWMLLPPDTAVPQHHFHEEGHIHPRTVRSALDELEMRGLVTTSIDHTHTRRKVYEDARQERVET